MKRTLVALLTLVLGIAGAAALDAASSSKKKASPTPSAGESAPRGAKAFLAGWSGLTWGMTAGQVLAQYPNASPLESQMGSNAGSLQFRTSILNHSFLTVVRFRGGGLCSVTHNWFSSEEAEGEDAHIAARRVAMELKAALMKKYGSPDSHEEPRTVQRGTLTMSTERDIWLVTKTFVSLSLWLDESTRSGKSGWVELSYEDATEGALKEL